MPYLIVDVLLRLPNNLFNLCIDDEDEETGMWQKTFYLWIRSHCTYIDVLKVFINYKKILSSLCLEYIAKDMNFINGKIYAGEQINNIFY